MKSRQLQRVMKWNATLMISSFLVIRYQSLPAEQWGKSQVGRCRKAPIPSVWREGSHETYRVLSVKHTVNCLACSRRSIVLLLDLIYDTVWQVETLVSCTSSWTLRPAGSFGRAHFLPWFPSNIVSLFIIEKYTCYTRCDFKQGEVLVSDVLALVSFFFC